MKSGMRALQEVRSCIVLLMLRTGIVDISLVKYYIVDGIGFDMDWFSIEVCVQ